MEMKKINIFGIFMAALLAGVSCQKFGEDYYKSLVPGGYHKVLSFKESGSQVMQMSVDDPSFEYQISVLRGGVDVVSECKASIKVMTQDELDSQWNVPLGTKYRILPEELYSMTGTDMLFAESQTSLNAKVSVEPGGIYARSKSLADGQEYVLPLCLVSEEDSVNVNKRDILLRFNVSPIVVSFNKTVMYPEMFSTQSSAKVYIEYEKEGKSPVEVKLSTMTSEEIASQYSSLALEGYEVVEPSSYTLPESVTIESEKGEISLTVRPDAINRQKQSLGFNKVLVIPVKMTTTSDIAKTKNSNVVMYCFHTLCEEIDAIPGSYWGYAMEYLNMKPVDVLYGTGCCNAWGEHIMMLDGNQGTGWLTYIEDGYSGSRNFGKPFIVLDFRSEILLSEIGFMPLDPNSTNCRPYAITYYGTNQDPLGNVTFSDSEHRLMSGTDNVEGNGSYIMLDAKMREHDATIQWEEIAKLENAMYISPGEDRYIWTEVPQTLIENKRKYRYFKIEITSPDPSSDRIGDRSRICELGIRKVVMYNGMKM